MSDAPARLPRLGLHLRVQHGLLAALVLAALGTGLLLGQGSLFAARLAPPLLRPLHLAAGIGACALALYHVAHLLVTAYLEGGSWSSFPMRWDGRDAAVLAGDVAYVLGGRAERPEAGEHRPSQKAMYWGTLLGVVASGLTGLVLAFWEKSGLLGALGALAVAHRGLALVLLAVLLWHLYGALVWEGAWWPEWSWLTGTIDAEKARRKLPGFHRRSLAEAAAADAALHTKGAGEAEAEHRRFEADAVQTELSRGNQFALEEKFVEALYHYRRALELYPAYSQARYNMARVLARMGEKEMAREAFQQFLDADPFHPLAEKAREALRELEGERG